MKNVRRIVMVVMAAFIMLSAQVALAEYPERQVTMIVPFSAGGGTDSVARIFAAELAKTLDANIIVKNVDGAAGTLGTAELASAKPDGYTIGFIPTGPIATQPHLRKLPYTEENLAPVACVTLSPVVFMVAKDAPWNTIADMVKDASANPNKYIYGSSGPGTVPHIAMAAAMKAMGIEARHIPDPGTAQAMKSMAGGVIQFFADVPSVAKRYDVKVLAVFANERLPSMPDVPTMKELGYDLQFSVWRGVFAPAGLPAEVLAKLSAACEKAVKSSSFVEMANKMESDPLFMNSKDFTQFYRKDFQENGLILQAVGLKK